MLEQVKIAFVGCTHPHIFARLQILSNEPGVHLVGGYDPDANLTAALERDYGLKAYASPEALLDEQGVNFAIIEGWDTDNPRYVQMAAERSKAILLEKPGAANLTAMQAVVSTIEHTDVPFQVGYMLRYSASIQQARQIIEAGVLGPITLARFHASSPVGGAAEPWQSVPGDTGGVMYTIGCHMIDLIVYLLGMPKQVKGISLKLPAGAPVTAHGYKQDTLSGLGVTVDMPLGGLMYEDAGAALLGYGDKLATFDITGWEAHPWVEGWLIELYGTDGTLFIGIQPPRYRLYVRNANHGYEVGWHTWVSLDASSVGNSLLADDNYTAEIRHMLRRVRAWDSDNTRWLADAEGVVAILDAIFRSDREGSIAQTS